MENIANAVDNRMKQEAKQRFMRLHVIPFVDLSVLVWDPYLREWGSAFDGNMCTLMLRAGFAPKKLSRRERAQLKY